jgi:hypothetical protein
MKLFLDFEFTGLRQHTSPISIGIVSEDGREFYAEFMDFETGQLDDWIKRNIIPNTLYLQFSAEKRQSIVKPMNHYCDTRDAIVRSLVVWLRQFEHIEMWGDCMAYDWVLFCQLFGGALNLPRNIYYIPFDICTRFKDYGIDPDIDRQEFANHGTFNRDNRCIVLGKSISEHNAICDARTLKACYERLENEYVAN